MDWWEFYIERLMIEEEHRRKRLTQRQGSDMVLTAR
jgi:hypothetical protein